MASKKWRPPCSPTPMARQVWAALYPGEPWPRGWRVVWVGWMRGAMGLCDYGTRRILLSHGDHSRKGGRPVETLVHEFVHLRCRGLRHGREFSALVSDALARIGLEPEHYCNLSPEGRRAAVGRAVALRLQGREEAVGG